MVREVKYDWLYGLDNDVYGDYENVDYELRGYDGNDHLFGNDGDDLLLGGDGDDWLFGGDGDDELKGGDGNDTFLIDRGDDTYVGGTGTDTLSFIDTFVLTNVTFGGAVIGHSYNYNDFRVGFSFDAQSGATFAQTSTTSGYTDDWGTKTMSSGINRIFMTKHDDVLRDSDATRLLFGNEGNDLIEGRGGADQIFGGDGIDTASYESSGGTIFGFGVEVNLLTLSGRMNDAEGDFLGSIENLIGSNFNDKLTGDNGTNRIEGGNGGDVIVGGQGADVLVGGAQGDLFTLLSSLDSTVGVSGRDVILDFQRGSDKIDLSAIDARPDFNFAGVAFNQGDQAFQFIGSSNFSGQGGQLRVSFLADPEGQHAIVSGDINGDRLADFAIEVGQANGIMPLLSASDFIL